jgi:hypothetical protein
MNVVEARNQLADDKAIENNLDVLMKIFNGTQGHVTPRDLSINLRQMGRHAADLSDKAVFTLGAIIFEQKKDVGE